MSNDGVLGKQTDSAEVRALEIESVLPLCEEADKWTKQRGIEGGRERMSNGLKNEHAYVNA